MNNQMNPQDGDDFLISFSDVNCMRCHWNWTPRKKNPKSCPRCKNYDWNKERGIKKVVENNLFSFCDEK